MQNRPAHDCNPNSLETFLNNVHAETEFGVSLKARKDFIKETVIACIAEKGAEAPPAVCLDSLSLSLQSLAAPHCQAVLKVYLLERTLLCPGG